MSFDDAVLKCFARYAAFGGRAGRREFWYFMLLYAGAVVLATAALVIDTRLATAALAALAALTPPALAVTVRRLHDVGAAGWTLVFLVPVIGQALLVIWLVWPSVPRLNRFGPRPGGERERILLFAR